jgi:hypothetical protein
VIKEHTALSGAVTVTGSRAEWLEHQGPLAEGEHHEEMVVIRGVRP